jgi:hypothetical protein
MHLRAVDETADLHEERKLRSSGLENKLPLFDPDAGERELGKSGEEMGHVHGGSHRQRTVLFLPYIIKYADPLESPVQTFLEDIENNPGYGFDIQMNHFNLLHAYLKDVGSCPCQTQCGGKRNREEGDLPISLNMNLAILKVKDEVFNALVNLIFLGVQKGLTLKDRLV